MRRDLVMSQEVYKDLRADEGCKYDQVIEVDLAALRPLIKGLHTGL